MKQVLLIGKLNDTTRELYEQLALVCAPQLCADSESVIQGMLTLLKPGVAVACLDETEADPVDVVYLLESAPSRPAVVAVGSVELQGRLIKERYLPNKRITFLQSPVKPEDVATCVRGVLNEKRPAAGGRRRILAADDDPVLLRTLSKMLSSRWNVSAVTSGAETLTAAAELRPDMILLDYDMPLLNGQVVLETLRADPRTKDIPVVFLTGQSNIEKVEELLALHPEGYLLKPPVEEKIVAKIESVLGEQA